MTKQKCLLSGTRGVVGVAEKYNNREMSQSKTLYFNFNQEAANSRMRQVVRGKMNVITENVVLSVRATDY